MSPGNPTFRHKIDEIKHLFLDPQVEIAVKVMLSSLMDHLRVHVDRANPIIDETLNIAKNYSIIEAYEANAHAMLEQAGIIAAIPQKLAERAEIMADQVQSYLFPGTIHDFGCGDGRVGKIFGSVGYDVVLSDIYRHPNIDQVGLEFRLLTEGRPIPAAENEFDNTLLLTVLHHSNDPLCMLREAYRTTKPNGRVIVIESVYGVEKDASIAHVDSVMADSYLGLSKEQQRRVNVFFDHFYNRVLHYSPDPASKVNVPYNFKTPASWRILFEETGLEQKSMRHLGLDQKCIPEYHTLHVLGVRK